MIGLMALLLHKSTQVEFVSPPILPMVVRVYVCACMGAFLTALSSTLAATGKVTTARHRIALMYKQGTNEKLVRCVCFDCHCDKQHASQG